MGKPAVWTETEAAMADPTEELARARATLARIQALVIEDANSALSQGGLRAVGAILEGNPQPEAVVAQVQRQAADIVELLASGRAEYLLDDEVDGDLHPAAKQSNDAIQLQVDTLRQAVKVLRGADYAYHGLLPSWRWDSFAEALRKVGWPLGEFDV